MASTTEQKNRWHKENNDQISLLVPKGEKAVIKEYAKRQGKSLNGYINSAIHEKMARDDKESPQSSD